LKKSVVDRKKSRNFWNRKKEQKKYIKESRNKLRSRENLNNNASERPTCVKKNAKRNKKNSRCRLKKF
jgi:hypothetical protein